MNKTDNPQRAANAGEFYALGIGDVFPVSSLHGRGVADLLERVVAGLPEGEEKELEPDEVLRALRKRWEISDE